MELAHLPIIDWNQSIKLAGQKEDLAAELISLLIKILPDDVNAIKQLHADQNYSGLLQRIHKLHGAVSYCGTPRLKQLLAFLESQLKSNIMDSLPSLLDQFYSEVNLLLEQHPAK